MDKRLLDYDPVTNICSWFTYDDATDETTISYTGGLAKQQAEVSQALKNDDAYTRKGMKNDMVHYAHITDDMLIRWHCMGINIKDTKELFRMVNKPEYAKLKTTNIVHKPKG